MPSTIRVGAAGKRTSIVSIASFDSLPEEAAFPPNPLSKSTSALSNPRLRPVSLTIKPPPLDTSLPIIVQSPRSPSPLAPPARYKPRRSVTEPRPFTESEEEARDRSRKAAKRRFGIVELVETERDYVRVLTDIDEVRSCTGSLCARSSLPQHFVKPLHASLTTSTPICDRRTLVEIFSNFADILTAAREMLRRLEVGSVGTMRARQRADIEIAVVRDGNPGELLRPLVPFLRCYALFLRNFPRALTRIDAEERSNERWRRCIAQQKIAGTANRLGLSAMLLQIVQRIPRYRLLLNVRGFDGI